MDSDEHEHRTPHDMFFEISLCKHRSFFEAVTYVEGGMFAVVATLCVSLHSYRAYGRSIEDSPYVSPTSTLIGRSGLMYRAVCHLNVVPGIRAAVVSERGIMC